MHKGAKFRQIGDAKQLVCMISLKKQYEDKIKQLLLKSKTKKQIPHNDMCYTWFI